MKEFDNIASFASTEEEFAAHKAQAEVREIFSSS